MPTASSYIAELVDFHALPVESDTYDKRLSGLASNAYGLASELTFIIDNMEMDLEPPVYRKAFLGIKYDQTEIEAGNWEEYISKLEHRANPVISTLGELIRQRRALEKKVDDLTTIQTSIAALRTFDFDLASVAALNRFHLEFVVVESKDMEELRRSLPEATIIDSAITNTESAVLVVGGSDQSDRIAKTLRSFDAKTIAIPKDLPQSPDLAYSEIGKRKESILSSIQDNRKKTEETVRSVKDSILGLREAAEVAYAVLDELKKSGKLKRVSMIQGYIPSKLIPSLEERIDGRWPLFKYEVDPATSYAEGLHEMETGAEVPDQPPSKFSTQNILVRAHEPITLTSGAPVYGEFDPTPILTLTFPLFFGIMFGDLGHGLLLMLVGGLIYWRGTRDLKTWGLLILLSGISATFWGAFVGEIFGFDLGFNLGSFFGLEPLKQAISLANPNGLAFNISTVLFFIKFTVYIGIAQLYVGMGVGVLNKIRARDQWHIVASLLPTIIGYSFFLLLAFAFKDAHFSLSAITSGTNLQANVGLGGLIASIVWLFVAGPLLAKMGKIHGSIMSEIGAGTMEFLEWVVSKFLGNTVSYVRLAILLVVHAALLAATNLLWYSFHSIVIVPALVILNLLIFAFEGLIVYVQGLRLHLYEFFSKFYVGTGTEFKSIKPETRHIQIKWQGPKKDQPA